MDRVGKGNEMDGYLIKQNVFQFFVIQLLSPNNVCPEVS